MFKLSSTADSVGKGKSPCTKDLGLPPWFRFGELLDFCSVLSCAHRHGACLALLRSMAALSSTFG